MKRFSLACLFLLAFLAILGTGVAANPIPMPESDGVPVPDGNPLQVAFDSEKVVYTIDDEQQARVNAMYSFWDWGNRPAALNISLPFYDDVPTDLKLTCNGSSVPFERFERSTSSIISYSYAYFHLDFAACQTIAIRATYSLKYAVYSDHPHIQSLSPGMMCYKHFECRYMAETGVYWHNKLDTAEFQFRVKKELYGFGLEGFGRTEDGGYIVATKTYYRWTPDENIYAKWEQPDLAWTLVGQTPFILVVVWFMLAAYIVIMVRRRRRKAKNAVPVK